MRSGQRLDGICSVPDMTSAKHAALPDNSAIFQMAWPMMLRAMMLHGIVVIDAYLVAALGEAAIAAMGLATAVSSLMLGVLHSFSSATQILVAQAYGSGKPVSLKTAFYSGLLINGTAALVCLTGMWFFAGSLMDGFAHSPSIAAEARSYLAVFAFVIVAEVFGQALSAHFNGCGETRLPFYSYLIALPVNVGVSYVLIHGLFGLPALGVTGAAIGSAVSAVMRGAFLLAVIWRENRFYTDVAGWLHGTLGTSFRKHFLFALPIATTFISTHLGGSVAMFIYASMSVNEFAAMTLIKPWVQVVGTFGMAWAQSTGIIVGQLLGQGRSSTALDRFLATAWRGAFVAAALVAIVYVGAILSAEHIYTGLEAATVAALMSFLPILILLPFPKGSNAICGNTLRAAGETVYVMHIFLWSQWAFRIPATWIMVVWLDMSVTWVFSLLLFEEFVKFAPFHLRIFRGKWKHAKPLA